MKYSKLFHLFNTASATLKYPKIRFITNDGSKVQLYLASKGYIAIKVNGEYCGKLVDADSFRMYQYDSTFQNEIDYFCRSPVESAIVKGQAYGHCCFCGLELVNAISVHHGYGPICADKYGLPWESVSKTKAPIESILIDL